MSIGAARTIPIGRATRAACRVGWTWVQRNKRKKNANAHPTRGMANRSALYEEVHQAAIASGAEGSPASQARSCVSSLISSIGPPPGDGKEVCCEEMEIPPAPPSCLACKSPLCNEYMAMLQGHMLALRSRLVAQSAKLSYFEAAARLRYPSTPPKAPTVAPRSPGPVFVDPPRLRRDSSGASSLGGPRHAENSTAAIDFGSPERARCGPPDGIRVFAARNLLQENFSMIVKAARID